MGIQSFMHCAAELTQNIVKANQIATPVLPKVAETEKASLPQQPERQPQRLPVFEPSQRPPEPLGPNEDEAVGSDASVGPRCDEHGCGEQVTEMVSAAHGKGSSSFSYMSARTS
jgi:hypothetical protein